MTLKEILSEPEPPKKKKMKCGTCFYCEDSICKRYPPQASPYSTGWSYPIVTQDMWCGEWIEKK